MKKTIILFVSVLCFFSVKISFSQTVWQQLNPLPPKAWLYDVYFIDEFQGWAVGRDGVIVYTEDGGVKWNRQYSHYSGNNYDCVFFVNENFGFIAGNEVYKTENGGEDWVLNYISNYYIYSVFFVNEFIGWMGGTEGIIYKTENGGEDWSPQSENSLGGIKKIYFLDENTGWAITSYKKVLITTNGGEEWIISELGDFNNKLNDIFFIDETTGWIGTNNSILLKSIDGGVSWDTVQMNFNDDILKVRFFDENSGRVATEQYCYITNNGGSSWQEVQFSPYGMNTASFPNENFGCAVGDYNICYSTDGGYNWTNTYSGFIYDLNSLCLAAENKLYAVGNSGAIVFSNDGGENWSEQNSNTTDDLNEVVFTNENTGWIVGLFGKLLYTNNSGDDWITKEINTYYTLNGITFINPEKGWIVGDNGVIFKTTDGGNNWTEITTGIHKSFYDVCFVDQNIGWAVGTEGTIAHTNDGGNTWILQETPCDYSLYAVSFINQNKGWISGNKVILATTNGGEDWTIQFLSEHYNYPLKSISFTDSLNGWACGRNEALFHTIDGGLLWVNQNDGIINNTDLNCVVFTDSLHGYLTGEDGTVMYTDCGTYLAPHIIEQPGDTIVCAGTDISFQLNAIGNSLNYQWLKYNYMISGATFNPLTFNPITVYDGGFYNCYVFNEGGLAESDVFTVIVMTPPEITGHPIDITANINTYIAFNLAVTGTLPLSYQWQKNGVDIPGGNFHIYPIESVQLSDTGYYRCLIFNECDTVYTEEAKLTVIDNAGINDINFNQYVNIFPNPATDKISVKFNEIFFGEPVQISVFNLIGRKVYETEFKANYENDVCKINCKDFTKGVYFIEVRNENKAMVMKVVKN